MTSPAVFPRLRSKVILRKYDDYIVAYDSKQSAIDFIHPSHALLLSLCNGVYSQDQIAFLMSETYRLPMEEAVTYVEMRLNRSRPLLEFFDEPHSDDPLRYNPKDFLYNVDDDVRFGPERGNPLPVPLGISLNLTHKCNFGCLYCYQNTAPAEQERLNLGKCLEIIDEAAEWGLIYIGMTGGEPTLFKGWMTMLEKILALGMVPLITTNGSIIGADSSTAGRLSDMGLKEITVSLDASNHELHHKITNTTNTFSNVVYAIRSLVAAGIRVSVKSVLTPVNMADLERLLDFVTGLGVSEIGISYMEAGARGSNANLLTNLTQNELDAARDIVMAKRQQYRGICEIHPPRNAGCKWDDSNWHPCGGLFSGMAILPTGAVTMCDKLGGVPLFTYGNVFEKSLKDIWNGDVFRELRAKTVDPSNIHVDCARCSKLTLCRTGCPVDSMKTSGDYFAKHPECGGPF